MWRVAAERSREDKRTRGLADYLNANTMLYRGALFPSRLFYNSICDPPAPGGGGGGRLSRVQVRSFVHCNVVKSLRFHYDYIVLSFRISISFPSPRPSLPRSPPTPRLVFHFLILIFLFRTSRRDISFPILFNLVSCILFVSRIFSARERERDSSTNFSS